MKRSFDVITRLMEQAPFGIVVHRLDTSIRFINSTALRYLRLTYDQAFGKSAFNPDWYFVDEFRRRLDPSNYPVNRVLTRGEPLVEEKIGLPSPIDDSPESIRWFMVSGYRERLLEDGEEEVIVFFHDITERSWDFSFYDIVKGANDIVIVTDAIDLNPPTGPRIVYVNDVFEQLTGYSRDEAIGQTPRMLQGEKTDQRALERVRTALENKQPIRETVVNYTKDGRPYWLDMSILPLRDSQHRLTHFVAIERDVTLETQQAELLAKTVDELTTLKESLEKQVEERTREIQRINEQLLKQSRYDELTQLPNRRYFLEELNRMLQLASREGYYLVIAMLDLDDFKSINDQYGHNIGDRALQACANAIQSAQRETDLCGRLGGEEFAVAFYLKQEDQAIQLLERIRVSIAAVEIFSESQAISMTSSIGYTLAKPGLASSTETLLNEADAAMYSAKNTGKNCILPFHSD